MKSKITQALVERAPAPERGKSVLYADSEMRGFYLIVTPTKRSFYVQSLVNGKQVRTKLGDHPAMDAKQARDAARKTLVDMRGGANPNEERRKARARGITLRDALDLHLAASLTIGNHLLPPLLAELRRRHPQGHVDLALKNTEQVTADLLNYRIDLGFVEGPVQDERLQRFVWHQDRLSVFAPPDHPLAGRAATHEDLKNVPWILREKGSGTHEVFNRALTNAALPCAIAFELEQPEAIRQCVRNGLGLGCLSTLELRDAFQAGWLRPVTTPFLNLERQFQVVLHRDKPARPV